jgi:hypothetical protein
MSENAEREMLRRAAVAVRNLMRQVPEGRGMWAQWVPDLLDRLGSEYERPEERTVSDEDRMREDYNRETRRVRPKIGTVDYEEAIMEDRYTAERQRQEIEYIPSDQPIGFTEDARTHLAWLMWCFQEGYVKAEDREIITNWLTDPAELAALTPQDAKLRENLLTMADEVLTVLEGER